jgi:hypothetical protein
MLLLDPPCPGSWSEIRFRVLFGRMAWIRWRTDEPSDPIFACLRVGRRGCDCPPGNVSRCVGLLEDEVGSEGLPGRLRLLRSGIPGVAACRSLGDPPGDFATGSRACPARTDHRLLVPLRRACRPDSEIFDQSERKPVSLTTCAVCRQVCSRLSTSASLVELASSLPFARLPLPSPRTSLDLNDPLRRSVGFDRVGRFRRYWASMSRRIPKPGSSTPGMRTTVRAHLARSRVVLPLPG